MKTNFLLETTHFPSVPNRTETLSLTTATGENLTRRSSISAANTVNVISPQINTTPLNETQSKNEDNNKSILKRCRFTGNSNLEIVINFLIAFTTTLLFYFEKSDIIYHVFHTLLCFILNLFFH